MRLRSFVPATLIELSVASFVLPLTLPAQDVEALGERYGTVPPAGYFEELAANPDAYQFARGRTVRLRARMAAEAALDPGVTRVIGPRDGPVLGTYRVPVILGLFGDSPDAGPYQVDAIQAAYFSNASGTITDFYDEISG